MTRECGEQTIAVTGKIIKVIANVGAPPLASTWEVCTHDEKKDPLFVKLDQGAAIGAWSGASTGAVLSVIIIATGGSLSIPTIYALSCGGAIIGRMIGTAEVLRRINNAVPPGMNEMAFKISCRNRAITSVMYGFFGSAARDLNHCFRGVRNDLSKQKTNIPDPPPPKPSSPPNLS